MTGKTLSEDYGGSIGEGILEYLDEKESSSVDAVGASSSLSLRIQKRLTKLNAGCGDDAGQFDDFSKLKLKGDHESRPIWVCPNGKIYLEAFSPIYKQAYDFLVAIAEPVSRPENIHEYKLTPYSLYAAVSVSIETDSILKVLDRLAKNQIPKEIISFVKECTLSYGKAKLVLQLNEFYVESLYPEVLRKLLENKDIRLARVMEETPMDAAPVNAEFIQTEVSTEDQANMQYQKLLNEDFDGATEVAPEGAGLNMPSKVRAVSFKIKKSMVEVVKKACIDMDYPLMEEYDFRNDQSIEDIKMDLKPTTRIREYQEKSLSKMFGNGRARSGIIVLPCGMIKFAICIRHCINVVCRSWKNADWCYCRFNH